LAVALAAGVAVAALVPLDRPGLGWALAGLAIGSAIAAGVLRPGRGSRAVGGPGRRQRIESLAWGLVALGLVAVGTVRSAGWLFGLCLFAAAAATTLAVTGNRTVRGLALATLLLPAAAGRGAVWSRQGLTPLRRRVGANVRLGPTAAITGLLLVLFGTLLASADAAYSRLLTAALPDLTVASLPRWVVLFVAGTGLVLAATFLLLAPPAVDRPGGVSAAGRVGPVEWAVPVSGLVALFASFVAVQLTVLFGGAEYVLGPDGPSYAEYARGGFWQLLVVTALTLMVIGTTAAVAPRRDRRQQWLLRILLGALAVLTLVIVASALFRMHTYQQAYGFSRLRVLVSVAELWLGLVFLLVIAATVRLRAGWVPRAVVATGIVAVLALVALNPDRFIAEHNIDRWQAGETLDVSYLAGLSADAAPALVCLPPRYRTPALAGLRSDLASSPDGWRQANLSRAIARDLLSTQQPAPDTSQAVRSETCWRPQGSRR
jgi:hypothetical protein